MAGLLELGPAIRAGETSSPPVPASAPQQWTSNNNPFHEKDFQFVAKTCQREQVVAVTRYGRWYAVAPCRLPRTADHPEIGVDEVLYDEDNRLIGFKRRIQLKSTQEVLRQGYYTSLSMDAVQCSKFMELGQPVITVVRRRYCEALLNGDL